MGSGWEPEDTPADAGASVSERAPGFRLAFLPLVVVSTIRVAQLTNTLIAIVGLVDGAVIALIGDHRFRRSRGSGGSDLS